MDLKLITASISAIVAVITVLLQLLLNRKNSKELEVLKAQLEVNKKYNEEFLKSYLETLFESEQSELTFLKEYLNQIQLYKEEVRKIIRHPEDHGKNATKERLDKLANNAILLYSSCLINLSEPVKNTSHGLKHHLLNCNECIYKFLDKKEDIAVLIRKIDEISEHQSKLLSLGKSKIESIYERIKKITHEKIN